MSKKQKSRALRGGGDARHKLDTPVLEQQARAALDGGRWRDAMADFKELLKRETRSDWQQGLADAYAGRALELTAKDMLKEALAIWENRAALDAKAPMHPEHGSLLLRLGQSRVVIDALSGGRAEAMPAAWRDALRAQLAARVLGGDQELREQLPADDPVRLHAEPALRALHAYCEGRDEDLRAALASIPFRSPYRDWVLLLKALPRREEVAEETPKTLVAQLERVPDSSPFAPLKGAIRLALLPEQPFAEAARQAKPAELQVAAALRGWADGRLALWRELSQLGPAPTPRQRLKVLYRHVNELGEDWVRRKALTLVSFDGPSAKAWLRECGAPGLTNWETTLVMAWEAESDRDSEPIEIADSWDACVEIVKAHTGHASAPPGEPVFSQPRLRVALMLRRTEAVLKLLEGGQRDDGDDLALDLAAQLEESLNWDPDDLDTYLKLIEFHRRAGQLKDARRIVELGQKRWPRDLGLLTAAMRIALDGGAFKKATTLAKKVLEIDPINSDVRRRLIAAHFSHASKQIAQRRRDLARKELADAQAWATAEESRDQISLGLLLLDVGEKQLAAEAGATLKARYSERISSLDAGVELVLSCARLKIKSSDLLRLVGFKKTQGQGREDLLAALGRIRRHSDDYGSTSNDIGASLEKVLSAAPWGDLERGELEMACDTLNRFHVHKSCQQAAEAALKQWPSEPIFLMYRFQAKYPRGFNYHNMADLHDLEEAWHRARERGDVRTAIRIEKVLPHGPPIFGLGPMPSFFDREEDGDDDDDFDPIDDFFDGVGSLFDRLNPDDPIKMLEVLGAPKSLIDNLRKTEQALGREFVVNMVAAAIEQGFDSGSPFDHFPFPPDEGGPRRKPKKKKSKR
ncbi:hypothetical protein Thiowin_02002 [Thiorhodovibrio winogradskyi]|uniref:Tetratricopeptide repeat protein n=1 Tax=Thiorhodovibrio winogradskyi TaxID=77007 RepID=A0ABZ0S9B0_9GAMM|nr:hypothetical protein [Thiorhodovibrio winogradskyi]